MDTTGYPGGTSGKEPSCQQKKHERCDFDPWVGKIPWRRKWQHTPVFLPGKSHGWRSLVGYSPWGRKELDTTERLSLSCFPDSSVGKESICNAGDPSSIPGSGRASGEGIGYPLHCSGASLVAQLVKNLPAMWESWV